MTIIISGNLKGLYKVIIRSWASLAPSIWTSGIDFNNTKMSLSELQKVKGNFRTKSTPSLSLLEMQTSQVHSSFAKAELCSLKPRHS